MENRYAAMSRLSCGLALVSGMLVLGLRRGGFSSHFSMFSGVIRVGAQKSAVPIPVGEGRSDRTVGLWNPGNDMAGNAGMLPQLSAARFRAASGHSGAALEIKTAEPAAGGEGQQEHENQRPQSERCRLPRSAWMKACVLRTHRMDLFPTLQLLRQVVGNAHFLDGVDLSLKVIDVALFVLDQALE
jgi:hypothetical protein